MKVDCEYIGNIFSTNFPALAISSFVQDKIFQPILDAAGFPDDLDYELYYHLDEDKK